MKANKYKIGKSTFTLEFRLVQTGAWSKAEDMMIAVLRCGPEVYSGVALRNPDNSDMPDNDRARKIAAYRAFRAAWQDHDNEQAIIETRQILARAKQGKKISNEVLTIQTHIMRAMSPYRRGLWEEKKAEEENAKAEANPDGEVQKADPSDVDF